MIFKRKLTGPGWKMLVNILSIVKTENQEKEVSIYPASPKGTAPHASQIADDTP